MITLKVLCLLLCSIVLTSCATSQIQTYKAFNALARSSHLNLKSDGYIISIEKRYREVVGNPKDNYPERFKLLSDTSCISITNKRNSEFTRVTNDPTAMLVTHIVSFFDRRDFIYNAYGDYLNDFLDYNKGYKGLGKFQNDIIKKLKKANRNNEPYTHILIMVMGWNNDQYESIWRFNSIVDSLKKHTGYDIQKFNPLIIGFTWPSVWKSKEDSGFSKKVSHMGSYFTKSNDADEIAFTIINWLLNKQLVEIKNKYKNFNFPKIVAIGHSMGARILSRALFSKDHLLMQPSNVDSSMVDLFIGLQGAFSINRFICNSGNEGSPYTDFKNLKTKIVLTSSKFDKALPWAKIFSTAKHIGSKDGLETARDHKNIFSIVEWSNKNELKSAYLSNQVIMIDAKSIINGSDAHNDVLDDDMADLIWTCIKYIE